MEHVPPEGKILFSYSINHDQILLKMITGFVLLHIWVVVLQLVWKFLVNCFFFFFFYQKQYIDHQNFLAWLQYLMNANISIFEIFSLKNWHSCSNFHWCRAFRAQLSGTFFFFFDWIPVLVTLFWIPCLPLS